MPSLKGPTIAGILAWGGVLLGFLASLVLAERPGHADPQAGSAGSAVPPSSAVGKGPLPPLPAGSAGLAAPGGAPSGSAAAPGAAPPPYMYQEPWSPPQEAQRSPSGGPLPLTGAPAPYVYEPPPPAPPMHRSPWNSLWVGVRLGALFPFGNAYATSSDYYYEYGEKWDGLATGGPLVEGDVGVRFARHFILYGFWERAWMGKGSDPSWRAPDGSNFGDQTSATTDYPGLGFRWSSRPNNVGVLVDLGLGYRWFRERWSSGAKMDLEGFGEFRLGIGADVRVTHLFSLTPLLTISSGSFGDRQVTIPGQGKHDIVGSYSGSHGTLTLSVGGNFDLLGSDN